MTNETNSLTDNDFRLVLKYFNRPWDGYRKIRKGVMKRLRRHMLELGATSAQHYLQILDVNPNQYEMCKQCLLVTISRFFRDRNVWQCLHKQLLPEFIKRFPDGIRAWSIGCANGEEPYSLSILWELLQTTTPLEILATDTNPDCLERARAGIYQRSSLREISDALRIQCFTVVKSGKQYAIKSEFQSSIRWQHHDMFTSLPDGPFQLIFLRNNLLTYHQGPCLQEAFERIVNLLAPDGYLIIGSHEHIPDTLANLVRNSAYPSIYYHTCQPPS